jgi:hypothetical protein
MARDLDATFYKPIKVVLPREDDPLGLAAVDPPGTAFVAVGPVSGGRQLVYYEQPSEMSDGTFTDRVLIAHGRAWSDRGGDPPRHQVSTHKMAAVNADTVITVGSYDPREGEIILEPDPDARRRLIAWLGLEHEPDVDAQLAAQLQSTAVRHLTRRELRRALANPAARYQPVLRLFARRHGHGDLLDQRPTSTDPPIREEPELAPSWPQTVTADQLTISNIGETMVLTHVGDDDGEHRIEYAGGSHAEVWIYGDCTYEVLVRRPGDPEPDIDAICTAVREFATAAADTTPAAASAPDEPRDSASAPEQP